MKRIYKKKKCFYCGKVRSCVKVMQCFHCLKCFNETHYKESCKVCSRMGKFCKRHKLNSFKELKKGDENGKI